MKVWSSRLPLALVSFLLSAPLLAQTQPPADDWKKDIESLKESVKAIQKDVQDIKAILQRGQPTPPQQNVVLDLGKSPFKGERTAKLTLVEFSDYQ